MSYFLKLANRGRNDWWMYILTTVLIAIFYTLGQLPMFIVQIMKMDELGLTTGDMMEFEKTMDFSIFGISSNTGLLLMITIFVFANLGLFLGLKIHKKPFKDIITPQQSINFNKIAFGFGFWFLLSVILEFIVYLLHPDLYEFNFKPGSFVVLLLICLVFLPFQTSFEEFFFRGYLNQAFYLLAKNKWVPLLVTTVLFSLVHSANPEIDKYGFWTMQTYYLGAGLFLGLLVLLDDSLELALGVHFATNFFGATMVSYEGSVLQTVSLFKTTEINPLVMTAIFYVAAAIFLIVCSRKYNWLQWRVFFVSLFNAEEGNSTMTTALVDDKPAISTEDYSDYSNLFKEEE